MTIPSDRTADFGLRGRAAPFAAGRRSFPRTAASCAIFSSRSASRSRRRSTARTASRRARGRPDAVLLDLRLGAMDGFEVARTLRARLPGGPLGIIAISASVFESDRQQAIDAGCDDFLPKPFEEAQLLGVLGRVLGLLWVRAGGGKFRARFRCFAWRRPGAACCRRKSAPCSNFPCAATSSGCASISTPCGRRAFPTLRAALVRRLESLAATYRMDEIHALLLAPQDHDHA